MRAGVLDGAPLKMPLGRRARKGWFTPSSRGRRLLRLAACCSLVATVAGCSPRPPRPHAPAITWLPIDAVNAALPSGVRAYAGQNDAIPLRAWYVRVEEHDPNITTRVLVSDDPADGRETISSFARDEGACVVVNGGYFTMDQTPARHAGLLVIGGRVVAPATDGVWRSDVRYPTARAAIGFAADGTIDVAWVRTAGDTLLAWPSPPGHAPGQPAALPDTTAPAVWAVRDALGAGPALVSNGVVAVTADEEVFFGSSIPDVHPRTAAGRTADGALLLLVVDGRQTASRGVDLQDLARIMLDLGAVEALNLDGGGSSALVVAGRLLNQPTGGIFEREVMSAIATYCDRR